jgi:transposase-like protein
MINGERRWLWRPVDDAGEVVDVLVPRRRSALAAMAGCLPWSALNSVSPTAEWYFDGERPRQHLLLSNAGG